MIRYAGGHWWLFTHDGKRVLGQHETFKEAHTQEKAIQISKARAAQLRGDTGQYAVALDRPCTCGCRKGQHDAGPKGRSNGACQGCDVCEKFKAANR